MNRKERRARKVAERKLGKGITDREFPPGYVQLVESMTVLIKAWIEAEPTLPDLRWHERGTVIYAGDLTGPGLQYLANSPDAYRLCRWIDERTGKQATLFQMDCALRILGHLPGWEGRHAPPPRPDGRLN